MPAKTELSRRGFLKSVRGLFGGLFVGYAALELGLKWLSDKTISPEGETTNFSSSGADYTMLQGRHGTAKEEFLSDDQLQTAFH